MTRKHYQIIAGAVKRMRISEEIRVIVAKDLCEALYGFNSGFRPEAFLAACGVDK